MLETLPAHTGLLSSLKADLALLYPELWLTGLLVLLLFSLAFGMPSRYLTWTAVVGAVFLIILNAARSVSEAPQGLSFLPIRFDAMALPMIAIADLCLLITLLWVALRQLEWARASAFFLCSATYGVHFMCLSTELTACVIGLEITSISSYALVAWPPRQDTARAAMRFMLVGMFATACMLYGLSWIYGLRSDTFLYLQHAPSASSLLDSPFARYLLSGMVLIAIFFKVGSFPVHGWIPSVYRHAPLPVVAFISVAPKLGAAILAARFINGAGMGQEAVQIFALVAAVGMVAGNLAGLYQKDFFGLMAFSSVAHSGFLMMASLAIPQFVAPFYGFSLLIGNFTMFAFWEHLQIGGAHGPLKEVRGWGKAYPVLVLASVIIGLSLAGLPPTIGFVAKFKLVVGLFNTKGPDLLAQLALLVVVNSAIGIAYYLKIAYYLAFGEPLRPAPVLKRNQQLNVLLLGLIALVFFFVPHIVEDVVHKGSLPDPRPLIFW